MSTSESGMAGQSGTPGTATSANSPPRRSLLTLTPLGMTDLPPHSSIKNVQGPQPSLRSFIEGLFHEAKRGGCGKRIGEYKKKGRPTVYKYRSEEPSGTWFGRKSEHEDGEVTWGELDAVLRREHSRNEGEYTPEVFDCHVVLGWAPEVIEDAMKETGYESIEMNIVQMYHKMPFPLHPRVFTILVLAGVEKQPDQPPRSIIIQVPVDVQVASQLGRGIHHNPTTKRYEPGPPNDTDPISTERKSMQGKTVVEGVYTSVEFLSRVRSADGTKEVTECAMRTLSNAKGYLPIWLQNLGTPGKICKDPEYVVGFIEKHRENGPNGPLSS